MPTRKTDRPASRRMLQVEISAALFKALRKYCLDADTTLRAFVPPILAAEIGIHHETGKPLPRAKKDAAA